MARVLGYGGIANTNGARDFTGREQAAVGNPVRAVPLAYRQSAHVKKNPFRPRRLRRSTLIVEPLTAK